jgi:hypothetical protein
MDWLKAFSRPDWHHASQRMQLEYLEAIYAQNKEILAGNLFIIKKLHQMGTELDNLTKQVEDSITVEEGAIVLITGLKTELDAAIATGSGAALQALSDKLGAEKDKLAAAVVANTPAAAPVAVVNPAPADSTTGTVAP